MLFGIWRQIFARQLKKRSRRPQAVLLQMNESAGELDESFVKTVVRAVALSQALATGDRDSGRAVLDAAGLDTDYLERVDSTSFEVTPDGDLLVVAALVGTTRLIDNRPFRKDA